MTEDWTGRGTTAFTGPAVTVEATGPELEQGKLGELKAYATVLTAGTRGTLRDGALTVDGQVDGAVGADSTLSASVGRTGLEAEAEVFAGARVDGEVGADLAGLGVGARGEAWAGLGAEGRAELEFDDGKFRLGGSAGLALGVGGKVGFQITVDPAEVERTARAAADALGHLGGAAMHTAAMGVGRGLGLGLGLGEIGMSLNPFD